MEKTNHSNTTDNDLKTRLTSLYKFMANRLKIKQTPRIIFTQNKENAQKPFGLTAYYNNQDRSIRVYITDRHPTDILRSFAHELIHHWQNEHGAIPQDAQKDGHAHYAQKNPVLRKREMEAYLLGNILFRDWQDENRYGPINESKITTMKDTFKEKIKELVVETIRNQVEKPSETISTSELKELIKSRIDEAVKKGNKAKKSEKSGKSKKPVTHGTYADWLAQYRIAINNRESKSALYYTIGFNPSNNYFCWYWNPNTNKIVKARGGSHSHNFGEVAYETFRGRYDEDTGKLSLTIPEYGRMKITGKLETDVPPKLLNALKREFHNPEIVYFPFTV